MIALSKGTMGTPSSASWFGAFGGEVQGTLYKSQGPVQLNHQSKPPTKAYLTSDVMMSENNTSVGNGLK